MSPQRKAVRKAIEASNAQTVAAIAKRAPAPSAEERVRLAAASNNPTVAVCLNDIDTYEDHSSYLATLIANRRIGDLRQELSGNPAVCYRRVRGIQPGARDVPLAVQLVRLNLATFLLDALPADCLTIPDRAGLTAVYVAAACGQAEVITHALRHNIDVLQPTASGLTALHIACRRGHLNVVQTILQQVPEAIHDSLDRDLTPLHCAATGGHLPVVEFLLASGADRNLRSRLGQTALSLAIEGQHIDLARALLGSELDRTVALGENEESYLHAAARLSDTTLLKEVVESGCALRPDRRGCWPSHAAAAANCVPALRYFAAMDATLLSQRDHGGNTPLDVAAAVGKEQAAQFLAAVVAPVGEELDEAEPAVGLAAASGSLAALVALHSRGANLAACGPQGDALSYAMRAPHDGTFQALVGLPPFDEPKRREAAAMTAAIYNRTERLRYLIDHGGVEADLRAQSLNLLEATAHSGSAKTAALLLQRGAAAGAAADKNAKEDALQTAVRCGHFTVARQLLPSWPELGRRTAQGQTLVHMAVSSGSLPTLVALLQHGAPMDELDLQGETPLMQAARLGRLSMLQMLLALGARRPTVTIASLPPVCREALACYTRSALPGETRLHAAARAGWDGVIPVLLRTENKNATNDDRQTALHVSRSAACTRALLQAGADPTLLDAFGKTPLDQAITAQAFDCIEILRAFGACTGEAAVEILNAAYIHRNRRVFQRLLAGFPGSSHDNLIAATEPGKPVKDVFRAVVRGGLCLDARSEDGVPLLFLRIDDADTVALLVEWLGFPSDIRHGPHSNTILHEAAKQGSLATAQWLLTHHPKLASLTNRDGYHPGTLALRAGHSQLAKVIFAAVAADRDLATKQLKASLALNDFALSRQLMDYGCRLRGAEPSAHAWTCLVAASQRHTLEHYLEAIDSDARLPDTHIAQIYDDREDLYACENELDRALHHHRLFDEYAKHVTETSQPPQYSGRIRTTGQGNGYSVVYAGRLRKGNMDGFGVLSIMLASGTERSEGVWRANKLHGLARVAERDGSVFVGEFVDGRRHGRGRITAVNGICKDAWYENDIPQFQIGGGDQLLSLFDLSSGAREETLLELLKATQPEAVIAARYDGEKRTLWDWATIRNSVPLLEALGAICPGRLAPGHPQCSSVIHWASGTHAHRVLNWLHQQGVNLSQRAPYLAHDVAKTDDEAFARWLANTYPLSLQAYREGLQAWEVCDNPQVQAILSQHLGNHAALVAARQEALDCLKTGRHAQARQVAVQNNLDRIFRDGEWLALRAQLGWFAGKHEQAGYLAAEALRLGATSLACRFIRLRHYSRRDGFAQTNMQDCEALLAAGRQAIESFGGNWAWLVAFRDQPKFD